MQDKDQSSPVPDPGPPNHQVDPALRPAFGLTARENEVLKLSVEGLTYNQIARQLAISKLTVSNHLANIYRKLGVTTRVQALLRALEHSLVEVNSPVPDWSLALP